MSLGIDVLNLEYGYLPLLRRDPRKSSSGDDLEQNWAIQRLRSLANYLGWEIIDLLGVASQHQEGLKMWRRLTFFLLWFSIQHFPKSPAVQPRISSAVSRQGSKRFCTCVGLSISPIAYLVYTSLTSTLGSLSPSFFHEWWLPVALLKCDCV